MRQETDNPQTATPAGLRLRPGDRRAGPRFDVLHREVVVVDLHHGNGGVLLNCSPGGIAIQAVAAPLQLPGYELLLYLPGVAKPLVVVGDVVWVNESHEAGIRFAAIDETARSRFVEWLERTARAHPTAMVNTAMMAGALVRQTVTSHLPAPQPARPALSPPRTGPSSAPVFPREPAIDPGCNNDSVPWKGVFAAAAIASLALTLLWSSLGRRAKSPPPSPPPTRPPQAPALQLPSPGIDASAAPAPAVPAARHPKVGATAPTAGKRPGSRSVRRPAPDDEEEEVIVRHFARPTAGSQGTSQRPRGN